MKNGEVVGIVGAISALLVLGCGKSSHLPEEVEKKISGGAPAPGIEGAKKASRIAIKRATDPDSSKIDAKAKSTTIAEMLKLVRPDGLAADDSTEAFQKKRIGPFETTTWQLDTTVTEIVKRSDGDFYLVLEDGKGNRTVCEVPDPSLCAGSSKLAQITEARKVLDDKFHPNEQPQKIKVKARITGLGFFGMARSRDGKPAGNGARIMPGLKIEWLK